MEDPTTEHEAMLYESLDDDSVRCNLCAHRCSIREGRFGICKVRLNQSGVLYNLSYGQLISQHLDPIEKKPLYHFYPGTSAYSIATAGCNFRCQWCQNWQISQMPREGGRLSGTYVEPEQVIQAARNQGAKSIAYTYTEPTIFFEYAYEISRLAHEAGMANLFITNGYMTEEMLEIYAPYLDAANVDLKAFKDSTYRKYVGAQLQPVLDSLKEMRRLGIWVEVTTLVIPELNDDPDELREAASFVANELGPQTPWHLSAFFPAYKMRDYSATSLKSLLKAKEIGKEEGLWHIYLGNARSAGGQDTICPSCGQTLIRRSGFGVTSNEVRNGRCPECGTEIAGVWQTEDDHIQ